jgi:branched-chain amino acid transport system substrate-binding protein
MSLGRFAVALTIAASTVSALGPMPAAAQTVVKIGLISSYSGFVAQAADQAQKGIDLYLNEHEQDLPPGVRVELIRRDDTSNPEVGKRLAQELITRERVQLLSGIVLSPVAAAIAPLTAEAKVPLLISIAAAGVEIPRMSPYVARVTVTLWQLGYPIGKWAAEQGWKKAYTAVSDFIPGHDSETAFTKGFSDGGGQIVGAVRFPPSNPDFAPFAQRIRDAKPDVAFLWVPAGQQGAAMIKAVNDLGVRQAGIGVISTQDLLPDEELPRMGDAPLGIITSGTYSTAGERPANTAFLAAWKREYADSAIPNFLSVDAWDGMAAVFDLIKATQGKFTADAAMAFFKTWKNPDSPRGPIMIDPETRDIVQNVYIRRVERQEREACQCRDRDDPNGQGSLKGIEPGKIVI